jgi:hypothetical protein
MTQQQQQPRKVQIFSNQTYAVQGSAILGILNTLKDELPIRNGDTVAKVEAILASTVFPISLEEEATAPVVPNIPIVPTDPSGVSAEG